jgi:tricorn protease
MTPAYLRMPSVSGETLAFVCDDDLWTAPLSGGTATRVTAGLGEPAWPALSPDGRWLAFSGRDELHAEVWLMPAAGGPARRMTWLGTDTLVRGWTPDGHIVFTSHHGRPFLRDQQAWTLDPEGGAPQRLMLGQVNHLAFDRGGVRVIGRNTTDPARWKRYRGGTVGQVWVDAPGSGEFIRLELPGNVTSPMWVGGRIWFLGDHEGVGNLYSCAPDGSGLSRHTDHDDFYARHAATDGRHIVYQCGAALWCLDPAAGQQPRRIELEVPAARVQTRRRAIVAADHLGHAALHPEGHSLALELRGKLVSAALWEGAVRQSGQADGVRYRFGQWLADGRTLAVVSDADGEERIELHHDDGLRVMPWGPESIGRVVAMVAAPRGDRIAIANHRNQLWLGDTGSGALTLADQGDAGRLDEPAWSPCGGWLAYAAWTSARQRAIKLLEVATGRVVLASQPEFQDWSPAFDPEGKYLYFLSNRTFDPVYDSLQFEMSFPRGARPYLIALHADATPPFEPEPRGMKEDRRDDKKVEKKNGSGGLTRIDLDGLAQRVAPFPVSEGRFGQIVGAADGLVLWTRLPVAGAHGRGGHKESPGQLERFDLAKGTAETLTAADHIALAADATTLLLREDRRLRVIAADADPKELKDDDAPGRKSGWIDLTRVRLMLDPRAEWRQMLREVWRLQRDQFWVEDLSGIDWPAVWERYAPLLEGVATRAELSDLIWELQGELGTSHAYEMGGDHRKPPPLAVGHLAADLHWDGQGWAIDALARGDAWDPAADSPLAAIGVLARPGERIVAVGGQPLSADLPPAALLLQHAGAKAELTLASDTGLRRVLVKPLADEMPARYRAWVEANRAWVHAQSGGKVGYLHIPDMMSAGFAEFHRYFLAECDREGLLVDVRYNRGGHVSQLLLEKLARRRIGWNLARWNRPTPYPDESRAGPVVALTNEHAGSDGDIFSHGFKMMKLGTLVGTRTWGGVIGIWPRHDLADGSSTTQPEFSFWFEDVGWGVENHGTDPQIEVFNAPQDAVAGRDRQLETALATVQEAIVRDGVSRPVFSPRPVLAAGPLPPR